MTIFPMNAAHTLPRISVQTSALPLPITKVSEIVNEFHILHSSLSSICNWWERVGQPLVLQSPLERSKL